MRSTRVVAAALAAMMVLAVGVASAGAAKKGHGHKTPHVTIRTTQYGIPHIVADGWRGLGYGYGYSLAKQNICTMADTYTTVRGERSRYFGPDATWTMGGNGATYKNIDLDFFFKKVEADGTVKKLRNLKPPKGPMDKVKKVVHGYVEGYNRYLKKTGVNNLPDRTCRGKPWVKPITADDVYSRFYELGIIGSQGAAIDGIVDASPPGTPASARQEKDLVPHPDAADFKAMDAHKADIGSNAVALGSKATKTKKGMLLGNPHFPWQGSERFFESQLTIPGKIDASGASLLGVPVILIGHTRNMAWSHTVSTAYRFVPYQEKLVPGDPTSYYVDGQPRKMDTTTVTVQVKMPDGSLENRTHTFYSTIHGPVTTSILGQSLFGWTDSTAYTMYDANADNFRYLNFFADMNSAQSTGKVLKILEKTQGVPWVNTIATDSKGHAFYADMSVTPNAPDSKVKECLTPGIGTIAFNTLGLPVFDGSRSSCDMTKAPGAVVKGILPPSEMPHLQRRDYVTNSNDSYWLSNPKQPLEGYARIIGDEGTPRSLRTRLGLIMVQQRLDGTDGRKGKKFTLRQLQGTLSNDRVYAGELFRAPLAAYCQSHPVIDGVDVSEACPVLAAWDSRDTLDSPGSVLFRRIMAHFDIGAPSNYTTPFDVNNPVYTPSGLNLANQTPEVRTAPQALADGVTDLRESGIPLDATLRDYQYVVRNGKHIPIHGGTGDPNGTFNAISAPWVKGVGFPDVTHGSSFIMAASMTGAKCPPVKMILTYSQAATNSRSKHYDDQTKLFSKKKWVKDRFCKSQQLSSPGLKVTRFAGGSKKDGKGNKHKRHKGHKHRARSHDPGYVGRG